MSVAMEKRQKPPQRKPADSMRLPWSLSVTTDLPIRSFGCRGADLVAGTIPPESSLLEHEMKVAMPDEKIGPKRSV